MASDFHRETSVEQVDDTTFSTEISGRWSVGVGANGGYASALLVNALTQFSAGLAPEGGAAPRLRSLTSHYLRPPTAGPAQITIEPVRLGRSLSVVDATMARDGKALVTVRAAIGTTQPTDAPELRYLDRTPPDFPPPDSLARETVDDPTFVRSRYDTRYAVGEGVGATPGRSVTGGWIRTEDHAPVDVALAVALTDCWIPAPMTRAGFDAYVPSTVDLTSHITADLTEPYVGWVAVHNRSTVSFDGYVDTDTDVWSADGVLLAQGRQISVLIRRPGA